MLTGDYDHSGVYLFPAIGYTGASISEYGTNKYGGSIDAAEARFTAGYQIVGTKDIRFTAGLGARVISSSEVVVKDGAGKEIYRTGSSALNGLALDLRVAYMF
jgi:hypothetical protein